MLGNLLDNAIKYSPDGGRSTCRHPGDGRLRFTVRDDGLGIPPAEQERIFEKFYRLDAGMSRGVGGSGLGLYICRELVSGWGPDLGLFGARPRLELQLRAATRGRAGPGLLLSPRPATSFCGSQP